MEEEPARDGRSGSPLPFNASFDDRPREYDDLRASGHMARRRVEFFSAVVDRFSGPVLEVGCGTGTLLRRLAAARPDRTFVGVEPLPPTSTSLALGPARTAWATCASRWGPASSCRTRSRTAGPAW